MLATGLACTALATVQFDRSVEAKDRERFESSVQRARGRIAGRLDTYTAMLRAAAGLFAAEPETDAAQFRAYVGRLDLTRHYPGIQGIGWTRRLEASRLDAFLQAARAPGGGPFRIWPEGERPEYNAIQFLEPLDRRNRAAIGFDMATEPVRRAAMERARDGGAPAATGKVTLVQELDERKQAGFLIYMPVYRGGEVPETVEARRGALLGFVYSPFRADDLFAGIFSDEEPLRLDVAVFDGAASAPEAMLHTSDPAGAHRGRSPRFEEVVPLEVAGRRWTLRLTTRPEFEAASGRPFVRLALAVGLLATGLLTALTLSLSAARDRAVRAGAALAEQRERWRVTLASVGDAIIVTDPAGRVTFANAVAEALTGWPLGEASGRPLDEVFRIVDVQTGEPAEGPASRALREGVVVGLANHTALIARDGTRRPIDDSAAPIRGGDGAVLGVVLVFRDISDRRHAERRLEGKRAAIEALNRVAPSLASTLDLGTLVQRATDAATELTGASFGAFFYNAGGDGGESYTLHTLSGAPPESFAAFPMPRMTEIFAPTFRGDGPVRIDDVTQDPRHGKYAPHGGMPAGHPPVRSYLAVPVVSRSGEVLGGLIFGHPERGVFDDRAERIAVGIAAQAAVGIENARLHERVAVSEDKFRSLADAMPQLAFMARPDGHAFWYNRRWYDYTGTAPGQVEGWGWQSVHGPEELPRALERWKASLATGRPLDMLTRLRGADGVFRPFLTRVEPLRDDRGRVVRWLGTSTDITERVEMERRLREADRRKDEFLAMLAHELRNPLAAIISSVKLLQMAGPEAPDLVWARGVIERQVKGLSRMLDDLLDVSRITRGKVELKKEPIDARLALNQAAEVARPIIDARRHELTIRVPPRPLRLSADPVRLEQIIVNLLTNAAKYTVPGGRIWLDAAHEGEEIVIRVRDTGIGIPPEQLPRMFDLFTQGERSLARSEGGLGIGLTIVQSLATLHGGSVEARSDGPGRGSEFVVRLPAAEGHAPERPAEPKPAAGRRSGGRLLIVEDNVDAAHGLARLVKLLGYEVEIAHDGPSGIATARARRPGVVLLDIGLPGMDGYEVARALREEEALAGVLIIAVSGYGQEGDRKKSKAAGIDHHLVKPIDFGALVSLIA